MAERYFLNVEEIQEILNVSPATAYKVIRQVNDEFRKENPKAITVSGRVNRQLFFKFVGLEELPTDSKNR